MSAVIDESSLVLRAMDGDRDAFSRLAARHWRRLLALARTIVADLEAEDVVQDGLIKAWSKLRSLREPDAFASWLTRVVANTAIAMARRRRVSQSLDGVAVTVEPVPLDERIDVARSLRQLAPRQRAVLHLTTFEGMTDSEISTALGISPSSVRAHRLRGRRRLVELLGGGGRR
jgi:RNA polymerase sigma-70 factor (ECF subfamily)